MKIGIIGAGQMGGTLARRFSELGHEVSVANSRGPESLADLAGETAAKPVSAREAARSGDVVIVTIPQGKVPDLPKDLFDGVSSDVVILDTGNYYPQQRDGRIADIEDGMIESRWVSHHLGRQVVKAFNNIDYGALGAKGRPARTALDDSWRQQPGTPVYTTDFDARGVRRALCRSPARAPGELSSNAPGPGLVRRNA